MSTAFPASDGSAPSSLSASAYMLSSRFHSETEEDEIDSLPSGPASDSSLDADLSPYDSDDAESDAEEEWRESMHQLELLLTMVLIPFVGKFLGRKCAYWGTSIRRPRRVHGAFRPRLFITYH